MGHAINRRRLLIEVGIITGFISVLFASLFLPWFLTQPAPQDSYADNKTLLHFVRHYDFSKGRSVVLEQKLDNSLTIDNHTELHFNLRARAHYYYRLGFFKTALVNLDRSIALAPDDTEYIAALLELIEVAHASGDYNLESSYQRLINQKI